MFSAALLPDRPRGASMRRLLTVIVAALDYACVHGHDFGLRHAPHFEYPKLTKTRAKLARAVRERERFDDDPAHSRAS